MLLGPNVAWTSTKIGKFIVINEVKIFYKVLRLSDMYFTVYLGVWPTVWPTTNADICRYIRRFSFVVLYYEEKNGVHFSSQLSREQNNA